MRTRTLSAWLVGALPLAVPAQSVAPDVKGAAAIGGVSTVDYLTLRASALGTPLRFGHVIPGSESIQLAGRALASGTDYGIDYETGVVYLKRAQRGGDQLTVTYRYDPQGKSAGGPSFTGVNSFSGLSLARGFGLAGGLGLTERAADGTVMSSNVFGWNNSLSLAGGKGSLGGLFLFSDRQKNDTRAGLSMDPNAKPGDATKEEGSSQFLLQNFRGSLLGGNVSVDYQEISKNFSAGGQVRAAGYSDADTARLMKERGLKRQGAGVSGMRFGNTLLSADFRGVDDAKAKGVDWSSYGLQQGGLKLSMSSQRVDKDFKRFADLGEANRDQLAKEVGLSRQNLVGEFAQKASKLTFSSADVKDDKGDRHAINRAARLDTGKIGLDFGDQSVDKAFSRVGSLTAAEQANWGRAVGTQRQWSGLTAALGGAKSGPQNFAYGAFDLKGDAGRFAVRDGSYTSKTWTLDHVGMEAKGKTLPTGALLDAEGTAYTKRIGAFFNAPSTNDGQRAAFLAGADVKRDLTRMTGSLGKGATLNADSLRFGQGQKGGVAQSVALNSNKVKASFRKQDFGDKFTDATRLMDFERARLGSVAGLQRTDVSFGVQVDKARSFAFGQTQAKDGTGDLDRTTLNMTGKGLSVNAAQRNVSKGFASAAGLVDPEGGLLAQFQGFKERDLNVAYTGTPGLRINSFMQDAENETTKETRAVANTDVNWQIDKLTNLQYTGQRANNEDPLTTLFSRSLQRLAATHSFGSLLTVKFADEQVENAGKNNAAPDSRKQYLALESQVDKRTTLKTEQTRTDFSNGDKENISANTVSTAIAKNVGVSVTDVSIDRKGDKSDEKKTNYGLWYDFGKGLRLNYGYAQSLVGQMGQTNGSGNQMFTFGQTPNTLAPNQVGQVGAGAVGNLMVGGGYGETSTNAVDPNATHTQSFANVGLSTAKPFALGDLKDLKVSLNIDQAADFAQYVRQNQFAGLSGRLGKNLFSFGYRDQLVNPNQAPNAASVAVQNITAVDRTVALTTDPNPKAPLVVNGAVKFRTLPDAKQYASRNVTVTARPLPGIEISNQLQTNLEQANPNAILGSTLLADRGNKWTLGYKGNGDTSLSASWEEKINDTTDAASTMGAVNLTLFQRSGGPLKLTYGVDEVYGNVDRKLIQRYSLQYDARASSSQTLSLYVGNTEYSNLVRDPSLKTDNWMLRMNYQIRF